MVIAKLGIMIQGLAMDGRKEKIVTIFSRIKQELFSLDKVTFVDTGFVNKDIHYFYAMERIMEYFPKLSIMVA